MTIIDFTVQMAPIATGLVAGLAVAGAGIVACVDHREWARLGGLVRRGVASATRVALVTSRRQLAFVRHD